MTESNLCPVCNWQSEIKTVKVNNAFWFLISCPRCGHYQVDNVTKGYLNGEEFKKNSATLSHAIRKMQRSTELPLLDLASISRIVKNTLPKPSEQANNFILWLGDNIPSFGDEVVVYGLVMQAEIGARTQEGMDKVVEYLIEKKLIESTNLHTPAYFEDTTGPSQFRMTLTMDGWEYYEKLKQGTSSNRRAFIAMKFGDADLDYMLANCFRLAIKDTGFDLFRLDDAPKAGLIDDRLRVEIRVSRFLIADLTHENPGAYWEAGYAEGLGKPVIYTCEKKKFEEKKTHFDTNHHTTVLWDKDNLEKTAQDLKNTIRATLPNEAKLKD